MAFVTINKGDKTLVVMKSAFEEYFANQGWSISTNVGRSVAVEETAPEKPIAEPKIEANDSEEEDWSEFEDEDNDEEIEKPLSEMNRSELEQKANSLGIDISEAKSNKQIREIIRNFQA